jgi:hypothetical protein
VITATTQRFLLALRAEKTQSTPSKERAAWWLRYLPADITNFKVSSLRESEIPDVPDFACLPKTLT